MKYDRNVHHRRSIRWAGYDYSATGAYFVTICTVGKEAQFGKVVESEMILNPAGGMVEYAWRDLAGRFPSIELDSFVIMPNHVHGIIRIKEPNGGAASSAPTVTPAPETGAASSAPTVMPGPETGAASSAPTVMPAPETGAASSAPTLPERRWSLGEILRAFKSTSAQSVNRLLGRTGPVWQRNYYERVLRPGEIDKAREYVATNPLRWAVDRDNPQYTP